MSTNLRLRGGVKLRIPTNFKRREKSVNPLILENDKGGEFKIIVYEHDIIRIIHTPLKECQNLHQLKYETIDPENFPAPEIIETTFTIKLITHKIILLISLNDLSLTWSDLAENIFLKDLKYRAYEYDLDGGCHHFIENSTDLKYYGLGERGSPLNLNGRHFKLSCNDALGYDAQRTDPLYKNYPFYLSINKNCSAHGIYYASHCEATIDFGCEIDALWGHQF